MRVHSLALIVVAVLGGCSSSTGTRTVTGQLRTSSSNAAVVALSMDHQQFTSNVAATGNFALQLPTGTSYELFVGQSRVDWPTASGPAKWARLGSGATLDLGHVTRQSDGHYSCDHHGSDGDHCDRDDDRDGGADDHGDDDGEGDGHDGDHSDGGGDHEGGHACDGGTSGGGGGGAGGAGGGGGSTGGGGVN